MSFKDELKKLRKSENLTQVELAEKLGISSSTVSMYECGRREPDFEMLETIADYFNVDLNQLTGIRAADSAAASDNVTSLQLSSKERSLVLAYRQASPEDRQIIDNIVERYSPTADQHKAG